MHSQVIKKMDTSLNEVVNYNLNFDDKKFLMNDLINCIINISWKGKVICQCGKEMKKFYLKYLVHLVGDIHQPMHVGRYEDYGGSKIKLKFKGRKGSDTYTNLHVLWDTNLIDDFKMSFTEWSNHLENKYGRKKVNQSNVVEWTFESHWWARDIYANTKEGDNLSYDYVYKYQPVLEKRLYYAGVRLGNLLNEIFS